MHPPRSPIYSTKKLARALFEMSTSLPPLVPVLAPPVVGGEPGVVGAASGYALFGSASMSRSTVFWMFTSSCEAREAGEFPVG